VCDILCDYANHEYKIQKYIILSLSGTLNPAGKIAKKQSEGVPLC